jgi:hypothetical protein
MKIIPSDCPQCGERVYGTADIIPGTALLIENDDGTFDYAGETKVDWDGQTHRTRDDQTIVCCANGHEWMADLDDD